MAVPERRLHRDAFIQKIALLVERIETGGEFEVAWTDTLLGRRRRDARFKVTSLHVFGSFARGAPLCGDIDLLMAFKSSSPLLPPERVVASTIRGGLRNVQLVPVLEDRLKAELERFCEARLLWSPRKRNWRAAVQRIEVRPDAGRYDRKTDALPVTLTQIQFYQLEEVEAVVDDIAAGKLLSTWVPIEAIDVQPDSWDETLQRALRVRPDRLGRKTTQVLPYVLQWMSARLGGPVRWRWSAARCCLHFNDLHAHLGRPALHAPMLERADLSTLILAPHLVRELPQGLWILERGDMHESRKAFEGLRAWVESEDGKPTVVEHLNEQGHHKCYAVELFRSERSARNLIEQMADEESAATPMLLEGNTLLQLVNKVEVLIVDEREIRVAGGAGELANQLRELLAPARRAARWRRRAVEVGRNRR